jgi:hypothetical protein
VKRFRDPNYWRFSAYGSYFAVVCPRCGKKAAVTVQYEAGARWSFRFGGEITFQCAGCGMKKKKESRNFIYKADASCRECEYAFSVDITQTNRTEGKARVPCPRCGRLCMGDIRRIDRQTYDWLSIEEGREPHFGHELFYCGEFKGKRIWALNEEHLDYLIDYVAAVLRIDAPKQFGCRTQSDHLPTFMKLAKNRRGLLRRLTALRMTGPNTQNRRFP